MGLKMFPRLYSLVLLTLLCTFCVVASGANNFKGNKLVLENLSDIKEWKKLIKVKTNVLIYFGDGPKPKNEVLNVLKSTAEAIRGIGTVALVDCSSP